MPVVDVFEAGGDFELGAVEPGGEGPIFFPQPLAFGEQAEPRFKIQLGDVWLAALFFQGLGHAFQAEGLEFIEGLRR